MLGNYRVAAQLVTSRVVLSSTELVRAEWTPFQTHCYLEYLVVSVIEPGTSG
jgi:hypothetical protein